HGSVPMALINELHPLQELLGQALPMLTAVPRANHFSLVRDDIQRIDPAARCAGEREGELSVWVGVLIALGHFPPGRPASVLWTTIVPTPFSSLLEPMAHTSLGLTN